MLDDELRVHREALGRALEHLCRPDRDPEDLRALRELGDHLVAIADEAQTRLNWILETVRPRDSGMRRAEWHASSAAFQSYLAAGDLRDRAVDALRSLGLEERAAEAPSATPAAEARAEAPAAE